MCDLRDNVRLDRQCARNVTNIDHEGAIAWFQLVVVGADVSAVDGHSAMYVTRLQQSHSYLHRRGVNPLDLMLYNFN